MTFALMGAMLFLMGPGISRADDASDIAEVLLICPARPQDCRPRSELIVKALLIRDGYAKATIALADGSGETDIAYLKKVNGRWIVLDQGTGVNPYELGIPREIW
jgi:hypothetical protein